MRKNKRIKQNIQSIQGRQISNNVQPECIRTIKVYDWVILTNRDQNKVPIPQDCFEEIEACRHAGSAVTAECDVVPGTSSCNVLSSRPVDIGEPPLAGARIVTLAFHVHIQVTFFCNGEEICNFIVPVSFIDDVLLCHPDGTEVVCDIFDIQCNVIVDAMLGNMVMIDIIMCKDIQVEAEVKLEVEAKFCGPRDAIAIPDLPLQCPFPTFPEQCPTMFPVENCECQGSASIDDTTTVLFNGTQATGNLTLETVICNQCSLAGSHLFARFEEDLSPTPAVNQNFTFVATQFNMPECDPNFDILTVTGVGTYTQSGQQPQNASFTLVLNENTNQVTLTIVTAGTTVTINETADEINVQQCLGM